MPELPEVESTARFLQKKVKGAVISKVVVNFEKLVNYPSVQSFKSDLKGARILDVQRRAKFLVFNLEKEKGHLTHLFSHLRMSGSYSIQSGSNSRGKHEHVIFVLCDGREIRYSDVRKFGRFNLTSLYDEFTSGLGPEPLDVSFTSRDFVERIRQYSAAIKPLLLNQSVIAGIGNIYADEALWSSGIHPCSKASILPRVRLARLYESIVRILGEAIDSRGTDFGDRVVYKGGYIPKIYGRSDQRCLKCGNKIKKIVVAQRGTHVCLKCQRQPTYVRQKV